IPAALRAIGTMIAAGTPGQDVRPKLEAAFRAPESYLEHAQLGEFARQLIDDQTLPLSEPIAFPVWGTEIDDATRRQMRDACSVPMARGAALMPDAHVGYGLPIGGVLALENAVIPYAV